MQISSFVVAFIAHFGGLCPANARMFRSPAHIQYLSSQPSMIPQSFGSQMMGSPSFETSHMNFVLYGVLGCVGLALFVLLLSCLYDAANQWRHKSHFIACKQKVQRVHEVLDKSSGEFPLCPYCVNFVPSKASHSAVVFLCGHRFHVKCANRWMHEQGAMIGAGHDACPMCSSCATACRGEAAEDVLPVSTNETDSAVQAQPDEFKSFILSSLNKQYPDIIRDDCVRRWCKCHTELWLSELSCLQYSYTTPIK